MSSTLSIVTLPVNDKSHHIGSPPGHFKNPWPSYRNHGLMDILHTRFRSDRNFVPVPTDRSELVPVRKATFGHDDPSATNFAKLKATWLGHASWLLEFPKQDSLSRGISILLDPVFAVRTSPVSFLGPKRYTDFPCSIADLPPVDAVLISHNHYDHLDIDAVKFLHARSKDTLFFAPLGNRTWFIDAAGIQAQNVIECDWWDALRLDVDGAGAVSIVCTPAQHASARTPFDRDATLWSSWAIGMIEIEKTSLSPNEPGVQAQGQSSNDNDTPSLPAAKVTATSYSNTSSTTTTASTSASASASAPPVSPASIPFSTPRVSFAGDTGYRDIRSPFPSASETSSASICPAFAQIGKALGPFDLALIPIGLYSPRDISSGVHCAPEDSVCLAQDIRAKHTLGMHFGTYRGGLSQYFEDVREPPRRFREAVVEKGLRWGVGDEGAMGICEIGETVRI